MKRLLRMPALLLLSLTMLTSAALADSGPKPQLIVQVRNAPVCGYYLDLLEEGEYKGHSYGSGDTEYSGIDWSYHGDFPDEVFLDQFRAAIPKGWHACTAQGTNGAPMWGDLIGEDAGQQGKRLHTFGYFGVPETYRIMILSRDGDLWVTAPYTRKALQSSVTVDWEQRSVHVPSLWTSYLLQFLATLLPTLAIEGALLAAFGFAQKRNFKVFLLVNLLTQGGFAAYAAYHTMTYGASGWSLLLFVPIELVIAAVEVLLYRRWLTGHSRTRAAVYGLCANGASALLGLWLVEPVWRLAAGMM